MKTHELMKSHFAESFFQSPAAVGRRHIFTIILLFLFGLSAERLLAGVPAPPGGGNGQLASWSFADTNWLTDAGNAPIAFTNIQSVAASYGRALQLDSSNVAFLQYHVVETTTNTTNLTVNTGCLTFWFQPSWSSATQGGTGPNVWGRFIEVGAYTTNSTIGWWSLYLDAGGTNIYFSAQTNSGTGTGTNYLSAPISWTSNQWHFVALNYSATNSTLFIDGSAVTNGPGVSILPGAAALADGLFIGSDTNGILQAHGEFNSFVTYNAELDPALINGMFNIMGLFYGTNSFPLTNAPSAPDYYGSGYNVVGGSGYVQHVTNGTFPTGGPVYFTNMSASIATNYTTTFNFSIAGGTNNVPYDVFGTGALANPAKNAQWAWLGQVYSGWVCSLTNQPNYTACYILGTPQDSNHEGLTDAYQLFVTHTDPNGSGFDTNGIPIAWEVLQGLNPETSGLGSLDPDLDGLINLKEYLYGTKPLVSEGFNVWVSNPAGISGIP